MSTKALRLLRRSAPTGSVFLALVLLSSVPCLAATGPDRDRSDLLLQGSSACLLRLTGHDADGFPVLQTVAYGLGRQGLLIAPLHTLERGGVRWEELRASRDAAPTAASDGGPEHRVSQVVDLDPAHDLIVLRAPPLLCRPGEEAGGGDTTIDQGNLLPPPAVPSSGTPLVGLRERKGYRPRLFRATLERTIAIPDHPYILLVRIPDGGGAGAGFLLTADGLLLGSILPPATAADPLLVTAVPIPQSIREVSIDEVAPSPREAIAPQTAPSFSKTAAASVAKALVLTADDQIPRALDLLDEVALRIGEFEGLLIERGVLQFRAGHFEYAVDDFYRAAELNPRLHLAHYNLGISFGTRGYYREAAESLSKALELNPDHVLTRYHLALALTADHRLEEARRQHELLTTIDPHLAAELDALIGD